jgi:transcription initiation factor TFIID TATA-box-binding protein
MATDLKIVNVIASARINGSIDIEALAGLLPKSEYNPEIFPGLILRQDKPLPTIIMFESGRISSHGSKSEITAKEAILDILEEIEKMGQIIGNKKVDCIRIVNVVGNGAVCNGKRVDLKKLYDVLGYSIYKPEQFPSLICKPLGSSVTCLVFSNGKIVVAGGKSENQVKEAFKVMIKLIADNFCELPEFPKTRIDEEGTKYEAVTY